MELPRDLPGRHGLAQQRDQREPLSLGRGEQRRAVHGYASECVFGLALRGYPRAFEGEIAFRTMRRIGR